MLNEIRNDAVALFKAAATMDVTNFADKANAELAATNAFRNFFKELSKDAKITVRNIRKYSDDLFTIIEEAVDEVVPTVLEDRLGQFAEIKTYARNESVEFPIPTTYASKRRAMNAIKKGARGGIYRAYRLDGKKLTMETYVETVGYRITLEELLTGQRTISEMISILADAWTEKIYVEVVEQLMAAALTAPAANKGTNASTIVEAEIDAIIRVVSAYGQPTIFGYRRDIELLPTLTPVDGGTNAEEIRKYGYVRVYKGVGTVILPNYLLDLNNTQWLFTEGTVLILPGAIKPVKVAFQGESYTAEVSLPAGGMEWHNHRLLGVKVLFVNNIGSYVITNHQT